MKPQRSGVLRKEGTRETKPHGLIRPMDPVDAQFNLECGSHNGHSTTLVKREPSNLSCSLRSVSLGIP